MDEGNFDEYAVMRALREVGFDGAVLPDHVPDVEDDTQWAALGAEFDAFRYAQLRVGVRHNLASNDDNDGIEEKTQFTAGLGLNIVGVRLDLGALYSDADVGAALELGTAF